MKPRKPLRKVSKKRQAELATYRRLKAGFLEGNSVCAKCQNPIPYSKRDLHHYAGRNGLLLNWVPYWIMLCRKCHDWVHSNVKTAQKLGYIAGPKEWGRFPK